MQQMALSVRFARSLIDWVGFGFLLTPDALYTDAALMMLKILLQQSHVFVLHSDIVRSSGLLLFSNLPRLSLSIGRSLLQRFLKLIICNRV